MSGVLVVMEQRAGRITRISWEALAAAKQLSVQLSMPVTAAIVGAETASVASEIAEKPLAKVVRVEHPLLDAYTADGFKLALQQLIESECPAHVVLPHTYQVRDYAPALAARLGQVLISDVIAIGSGSVFTRQLLQGRLNGTYRHIGSGPCFISVQAGAFRAEVTATAAPNPPERLGSVKGMGFSPYMSPANESGALAPAGNFSAPISIFAPTLDPAQIRTHPGQPFRASSQTVDLASTPLIVSVGRGIKDAENLPLVQALATALGAELAASRPICDSGWLPLERQVGSSGQTVAPKLYLAVGISGAIQHLVGMKGSQCIVAINKDPDAPIFEIADYGIVGDLFEVVPALTDAVKAAKG